MTRSLTIALLGLVLGEGAGLPEHGVDQRGLAVVDVRDDRDVAEIATDGARLLDEIGDGHAGALFPREGIRSIVRGSASYPHIP